MKKFLPFLPLVVALIAIVVVSFDYFSHKSAIPATLNSGKYKVEVFVQNLEVPWSMVFTDDKRMLVSERKGQIRVIENGVLSETPVFVFPEAWSNQEAGLMGLTVDPNYGSNKYLYACLAYSKGNDHQIKVVRLIDDQNGIREDKTLVDGIIAYIFHDGCRLKFGPDGKLFITTGEATQKDQAQKLASLNGKILRINSDGSIPNDNPFQNSPIYSYGHRNPQGIAWDPRNGNLWETEHGPSGFDGPGGGDEINLIKKGANYGWPMAHHEIRVPGTEFPKLLFTPAIAPSGAMFYSGKLLPDFKENFFFTALRGEGVYRAVIDEGNRESISYFGKLPDINVGRVRDIIEGPDGVIYFATSNRDGRGNVQPGDDKIYKITPQ